MDFIDTTHGSVTYAYTLNVKRKLYKTSKRLLGIIAYDFE